MTAYTKSVADVFSELKVGNKGLTNSEAQNRLKQFGPNEIKKKKGKTALQIFLSQFKSFIVAILVFAVVVSFFIGENLDAIVVLIILVLNAFLGFIQEFRAEKSIEALQKMASLKAKVLRDGQLTSINAVDLVPGDVVYLEEGDKVPADLRLFEYNTLQTLEASLTGESTPVTKKEVLLKKDAIVGDRKNMAFSGTDVTKGNGKGIVVDTGMKTELGKIAGMIQEADSGLTPLQKKLDRLGRSLGLITILIAVVVFVLGTLKTGRVAEMLILGIALAVAAIPEGLPAVVTISLALSVQKMVKKNALVRKLPSAETLGATTVICSDKTGTLTHNQMTVTKLFVNNEIVEVSGSGYRPFGKFSSDSKKFELLLSIGALCNNAELEKGYNSVVGDPTEGALIVSAAKAGLWKHNLEREFKRVKEVPFDSERKMMSTVNSRSGKNIVYTKGAADEILKRCSSILVNGKVRKMTGEDRKRVMQINDGFADMALRVLGFAYSSKIESEMTFVGLQAMIDPPREEAKEAIAKCKSAGIRVIMITGDHKKTAVAVGNALGLENCNAVSGEELDKMDLYKNVDNICIYARVSPAHKLKIVDALKKHGHIVAMTGDGVNDAPALKAADIGIAMGITGTDVAKESSQMILTDDNFASIVNAVEEGRSIYDNIKKFVNYLLSSNMGEVMVLLVAMLIGFGSGSAVIVPLLAIHILWMNLVTDGLPALALGVDSMASGLMTKPPRKVGERILNRKMLFDIVYTGVLMTVLTLYFFHLELGENEVVARTVAFTILVGLQMVRVLVVRMQYGIAMFSNKYLWMAIISSIGLQFVVIYSGLNVYFKTTALNLGHWTYVLIAMSLMFIFGMIGNSIVRRIPE